MVSEGSQGGKRLVAYIVMVDEPTPTTSELRGYLKERLPDYMIPWEFLALKSFPQLPNGKVDRRALPQADIERPTRKDATAPRTSMELLLAKTFKKVLGVEEVGTFDNFFEMGGHSLLSMQVIAQIERETGIRLNPGEFIFQTLSQIAGVLDKKIKNANRSEPKKLKHRILSKVKSIFS
jgi:acyl carrier protein